VEQYTSFMAGIFVGREYGSGTATFDCPAPCLGYSFTKQKDVTQLLKERFPVTAVVAVGACLLWIILGVGAGIWAALRRGRWQDRLSMSLSLIGYSLPTFFIGILLKYFLLIKLKIFDYPSYAPFREDPASYFKVFLLPWLTLALIYAAFYARLTRNHMLDTLGEDFIRTARAKGLGERAVIGKHAMRAGLTPLVTSAGLDFAALIGGAVIVEQIFGLPGIGKLALDSVVKSDLPLIMGTVLFSAFFIILANLVIDLLYSVIDPRVRLT
ncbi:MAG: ABC transporter permease, partial [Angustibacter sp.]